MAEYFRVAKNGFFTVMCNHHLCNRHLSLKSKGLFSVILMLPDGYSINIKGLAAMSGDGEAAVRTALIELEGEGYILRKKLRNDRGHILGVHYVIKERPDMEVPEALPRTGRDKSPECENHTPDGSEQPECENRIPEVETQPKCENGIPEVIQPEYENHIPGGATQPECENRIPEEKPVYRSLQENSEYSAGLPKCDFPHADNRLLSNTNLLNTKTSSSDTEDEDTIRRIKDRISYRELIRKYPKEQMLIDEIMTLLTAYSEGGSGPDVRISKVLLAKEKLRERLGSVGQSEVEGILAGIRRAGRIQHLRNYLLQSLFQASLIGKQTSIIRPKGREPPQNSFLAFPQRTYDYQQLEKQLLNQEDEPCRKDEST